MNRRTKWLRLGLLFSIAVSWAAVNVGAVYAALNVSVTVGSGCVQGQAAVTFTGTNNENAEVTIRAFFNGLLVRSETLVPGQTKSGQVQLGRADTEGGVINLEISKGGIVETRTASFPSVRCNLLTNRVYLPLILNGPVSP
jgi:hypothetical protein